jgi:hypothetical protein
VFIRIITFSLAIAAITACTTPYNKPKIVDAQIPIIGIFSVLDQSEKDVDVILIHGMCTHDEKWVVEINTNLAQLLGSKQKFTETSLPKPDVIEDQTKVYHLTIDVGGRKVRTHSILWSPATVQAKQKLCYDQTEKSSFCASPSNNYPYKRAHLNSTLKD